MVVSFDVRTDRRSRSTGVYPVAEQKDGQCPNGPPNVALMLERPSPRYSTLSVAMLPAYPNPAELDISGAGENDSSSHPRGGTGARRTFEFSLQSAASSAKPRSDSWLKLRLLNSAPMAAQRPRYIGGDKVEGSVILDCEKPRLVHSIFVILRGRVVTSSLAEGSHTFLEHTHTIWTRRSGVDPSSLSTKSNTTNGDPSGLPKLSAPQMAKNRLSGRFEWPFEFPFPTEFSAGERSNVQTHITPQTLLERGANVTIMYEIVTKVISGRFRTKDKITANVLYVPLLGAPPIPEGRAMAYQTGSYLSNPTQDETGWLPLERIKVRIHSSISAENEVNGAHAGVNVLCTVYIAKPLTFTRGTVIPCYLVCERESKAGDDQSQSEQGNSLFKTFVDQQCLSLSLFRRTVSLTEARATRASSVVSNGIKFSNGINAEGTSDTTQNVGTAIWWRPDNCNESQPACNVPEPALFLEGEIHLDNDLFPSCEVPFLSVSYTVSVSINSTTQGLIVERFRSPTSEPSSPPASPRFSRRFSRRLSQILSLPGGKNRSVAEDGIEGVSSTSVQIVTVRGEGPIPVSFMPRAAPKKADLSCVREVEYFGTVVAGFV